MQDSGAPQRSTVERRVTSDPVVATRQILAALPEREWSVLPARPWDRAGLTVHIAVGPQGVFVVDPRRTSRRLRRDELRPDGVRQDVVVGATAAAIAISRLTGLAAPAHVHPVLCFVGRDVELSTAGDVLLCSTSNLLAALTSMPEALDATEVRLIALELDASLGTSQAPAPRRQRKPRRRWFGPELSGLIIAAVASVGLWQLVGTVGGSEDSAPVIGTVHASR